MHAVTPDLLRQLCPTGRDLPAIADAINRHAPAYGIDTPRRLAAFLAQVGHETGGFRIWTENLNYSADGLRKTWPKRFPGALAESYARQPERIANLVYADRMGNGDAASGDGWRFRGRGGIQITGRTNYERLAKALGRDLAGLPAWLETPEGAIVSALWFWQVNALNRFADAGDAAGLSRAINGGLNGIEDRRARHVAAEKALLVTA